MRWYLRQLNCMVFGHEDRSSLWPPHTVYCRLCGDVAPASMQPKPKARHEDFATLINWMWTEISSVLTPAIKALGQVFEDFGRSLKGDKTP